MDKQQILPQVGDKLPNGATVLAVAATRPYSPNIPVPPKVLALSLSREFVVWSLGDEWATWGGEYFQSLSEAVASFARFTGKKA